MKSINNWLLTPYYFNPSLKFKLKASFILGFFTFIFLYVFRPFYLSLFTIIIFEYTLLIGVLGFIGAFITLYIPPLIFKNYFNEDNWTVGRNLLLMIVGNVFVGSLIWYFCEDYKESYNLKKISYPAFILYTFLVSSFPLVFYLFINEKNIREKRSKRAQEINKHNKIKLEKNLKILPSKIDIYSDNNKEHITFKIDDLIYITSQGNYASFFLKDGDKISENILRVTLNKIDTSLKEYSKIVRCHKSYIVNINYISEISGNARGYILKSKITNVELPVSRKFSKESLQSLLK